MDRAKAAIFLLLPIGLATCARRASDSSAPWRSYTSPAGFYSVGYPDRWTVRQDDNIVNIEPPDGRGAVTLSAFHTEEDQGDAAKDLLRQTFTEERPTTRMLALATSNWNGYEQTFHDDKSDIDWIADVACRPPVLVLMTVNDQQLASRELVYRRIMRSLRLLDVAPADSGSQSDGRVDRDAPSRARR